MSKFLLAQFKTVNEIPNYKAKSLNTPIQLEKRKQIKIGVIDDQPFEPGRNLGSYGYEIKELGDLKSVSEVEGFPIILCDLMDVGANFDKAAQGASIIKEIRKNYPAIYVVAYSGSATSDPIVKRANIYADGFIRKDEELDTWTEELDRYIARATDVREIWHRVRIALVEERIDSKDLLRLEDAYVQSFLSGDAELNSLRRAAARAEIGGSIRTIVEGLAVSTLFRMATGG